MRRKHVNIVFHQDFFFFVVVVVFRLFVLFCFFETGFLCVALAALELIL